MPEKQLNGQPALLGAVLDSALGDPAITGCYVDVFLGPGCQGKFKRFGGPAKYERVFRDLPVQSLRLGPTAYAVAFEADKICPSIMILKPGCEITSWPPIVTGVDSISLSMKEPAHAEKYEEAPSGIRGLIVLVNRFWRNTSPRRRRKSIKAAPSSALADRSPATSSRANTSPARRVKAKKSAR